MTTKSKVFKIILIVIGVLLLVKILFVYQGPVSGIVIDANTGKPIEGAIVNIGNRERLTDESGRYYFHAEIGLKNYLIYFTGHGGVYFHISCLVYKDGYAVYSTDEFDASSAYSFIGDEKQFSQKNNVVKLYRLPGDTSELHGRNVSKICFYSPEGPLIEKALESERTKAHNKTKRKQ